MGMSGAARLEILPQDAGGPVLQPAPDGVALRRTAAVALSGLCEEARTACRGLSIVVEELPDRRTLAAFEIDQPYRLLGRLDDGPGGAPGRLTLYRRPLLDYWAESGQPLDAILRDLIAAELAQRAWM